MALSLDIRVLLWGRAKQANSIFIASPPPEGWRVSVVFGISIHDTSRSLTINGSLKLDVIVTSAGL